MPIYLITNRVPDGFTPGQEAFAAWTAWFDSLGDAVADRGNPAFASTAAGSTAPAPPWAATRWSRPPAWTTRSAWSLTTRC